MAEERLKIESLHTGDELYYMPKEGILHCVVIQKQDMMVQVQDMKGPCSKWLTARQIEFECVTKQEMETPCEPMIDDDDRIEPTAWPPNDQNGLPFDDDDDPADWWKKGKQD